MFSFLVGFFCVCVGSTLVAFDVPSYEGWVTDNADIFSAEEEDSLEAQLAGIETVHEAEIAVLTLASLQGEDAASVAYQVASTRGIGKENADNGILVLIAPNERAWRIEVGYGLEGAVPDITAFQLGRQDLVPAFREGKYFQGVSTLLEHLSGAVAGTYTPDMYVSDTAGNDMLGSFLLGLFFTAFLGFFASIFTRGVIDSTDKDPSPTKQKNIFQLGSFLNMLPGLAIVGLWGLLYMIPLYYLWKWLITSEYVMTGSSSRSGFFTGGFGSGGSSFGGGGFGGFGGGSFGGGGAGGGW